MTSTTARASSTAADFGAVSPLMKRCCEDFPHGEARALGELFQPAALYAFADRAHVKQIDGRRGIGSRVFQVDTGEARPCPT